MGKWTRLSSPKLTTKGLAMAALANHGGYGHSTSMVDDQGQLGRGAPGSPVQPCRMMHKKTNEKMHFRVHFALSIFLRCDYDYLYFKKDSQKSYELKTFLFLFLLLLLLLLLLWFRESAGHDK